MCRLTAEGFSMRAYEIMTPQVVSVGPETAVADAAQLMLRHHISGLPVVDVKGRLIGIVSEGDFLRRAETGTQHRRDRWLSYLAGAGRTAVEFARENGRKIGEVMTPDPVTATEDMPLDEVVELMESRGVKRLPVMRKDQLVGIITRSDFLIAIAGMTHRVADASVDDERLRDEVLAALQGAPWRPCRLNVTVRDGVASLRGIVRKKSARKAAIIAAENVPGVKEVRDHLSLYPPDEEDFGGGDFVSLQEQPSTLDDEPL
jgi:CBS domain-containing protein